MKFRLLQIVIAACVVITWGLIFLLGYHEGDKHALDTMRLIGCQNSDVESFGMRELPTLPETSDPL